MTEGTKTRLHEPVSLPALHRQADAASNTKQASFIWVTRLRLGLLAFVATAGMVTCPLGGGGDAAGIAAAIAFFGVFVLELYLWKVRPERMWHRARALAESAKTIAWRYAVHGAPFQEQEGADELFLQRLKSLRDEAGPVAGPDDGSLDQITSWMRTARRSDFDTRRQLYLHARVEDQITWYGARWRSVDRAATRWLVALIVLNVLGMAAAILRATGATSVDALGLFGTLAAVGIAWTQTRQHESLAAAYATAHDELTIIRERIRQANAQHWPTEVNDAEDAISREHTMWQASRAGSKPVVS